MPACHYVIEPALTCTDLADLFVDIDLYSNRLGMGDQKQSDTISNLIKEIDKADCAFLLHGLYHLKSNGTMAIVLPHGVLFRGAAERQEIHA